MNRVINSGFDSIAQMLLEQKKLMDALEAENRRLRIQLADLQHGRGIAIVIEGKTIQLANEQENIYPSMNARYTSSMPALRLDSSGQWPTTGHFPAAPKGDNREKSIHDQLSDSFVL